MILKLALVRLGSLEFKSVYFRAFQRNFDDLYGKNLLLEPAWHMLLVLKYLTDILAKREFRHLLLCLNFLTI